jgi:hypothetical protein
MSSELRSSALRVTTFSLKVNKRLKNVSFCYAKSKGCRLKIQAVNLYITTIPIIEPMPLVRIEVKDKKLSPHSIGTYPPATEPTVIPKVIKNPRDILLS